jgi:glutamine synthetase adenylyltransferase
LNKAFPDPENAKNTIELFKELHRGISGRKEDILYLLSSHSRFLGRVIIKDPEILDILLKSEFIERKKTLNEFIQESAKIQEQSQSLEKFMSQLRRYKYRELARIIYRDIMDLGIFPEIMEELSDLASSILEAVFRFFSKEIKLSNQGSFAIIGMGETRRKRA